MLVRNVVRKLKGIDMSVNKNYYVIVGYDLTSCKTDKYEDWKWTDEGEDLLSNQVKGKIQLFDDPMYGNYLYIGHIFATGDEYEFDTAKISIGDISSTNIRSNVNHKVNKLIEKGIIDCSSCFQKPLEYKIIIFEECC